MKINKAITLLAAAIISSAAISAQSPYSQFGYGLLNDNASAAQNQMGGIGYAMNSGRQINVMNPASYAAIDTLTFLFDMGVDFTILKMKEGANGNNPAASDQQLGGGLDYITMQVPIGKRMGASFGLIPFSSVGYSFGSEITHGINSREGYGGINQLYLGFAGKIFKGFTLGANISYLFGSTVNDVYIQTNSGSTSLFERVTQVRDWRLQFGAQYSYDLNADNRLTAGLTYAPGKTLLGHAWITKYDVNADTESEELGRTSLKNNSSLPDTWGFGLNYRWQKRLMVEADITYQPWSNAKIVSFAEYNQPDTRFTDRTRFSLGAEFIPKLRGNYLQRITYRAGGFYNKDYIMVGDNKVREYGLSCGFGLPTLSSKTVINIGFEYRHRQAHPNPLLKENYFNIRLGVNFNELWFFQNKIK